MVSLSNHEAPHRCPCAAFMVRQAHHEGNKNGAFSVRIRGNETPASLPRRALRWRHRSGPIGRHAIVSRWVFLCCAVAVGPPRFGYTGNGTCAPRFKAKSRVRAAARRDPTMELSSHEVGRPTVRTEPRSSSLAAPAAPNGPPTAHGLAAAAGVSSPGGTLCQRYPCRAC